MEHQDTVKALGALAQSSRLQVFRSLVVAGPEGLTPGAIAESLEVPPATLSFHLKELSAAGLIRGEQLGRCIRYSADFRRMAELIAFLTRNCCGGDSAQCAPVASRKAEATAPSARARSIR